MKMSTANKKPTRLEKLKALAATLAESMDNVEYAKDLPRLAKEYRETIKEIEELNGDEKETDELGELLSLRASDGKSRTVRKNKTAI